MLHTLNGAKVFSKIDFQNSFLQIPLVDDLKAITTTFWIVRVQRFAIWNLRATVDTPENH